MIDIIRVYGHEELYSFLTAIKYPYLETHNEIIYYAKIFKFVHDQNTAGFVWLYDIQDGMFHTHLVIADEYKGRILTRKVVNNFYNFAYGLGAKTLVASPIPKKLIELYKRIGWTQHKRNESRLDLPYQWRKKWDLYQSQ